MNWQAWTMAAAIAFSTTLYAQEEKIDIPKEVEKQFTRYDTDKDGKISKAEYRAVERTENGQPEDSYEWLNKWKFSLIEFLAGDTDDNLEATKDEVKAFLENAVNEKSEKYGTLTKADIGVLDDEYLQPIVDWMLNQFDTDKSGKISKEEAKDGGAEGVMEYDANKDGSLDAMEIKQSEVTGLEALYEIEEGYTLKGEASTVETPDPNEIPEKAREIFNSIDADKDGFIAKAEMKAMLEKDQPGKPAWWGGYIAFLAMDADDDLKGSLEEYAQYGRDERDGVPHKFYPADRTEALNEIWGDLDADKDGKVLKAEWLKLFPGNEEFDGLDKDSDGEASKDEVWNLFKESFAAMFEFPEKDREVGSAEGTANPDDPMWAHYAVKRSWTVKNISKFMGIENVSYMKTEVVAMTADNCTVRYTMLDKDKQPMAGMQPTEVKIEFRKATGTPPADAPKVTDLGTETIKVEAGEIECTVTQVEVVIAGAKHTTKTWMHKKYPGLMVKSESTSDQTSSSTELVEFNE